MNERSDLDRVLRHWFDDGPSRMPDRVVDVVADRIARERQRPARRLPWRAFPVSPTFKIGAAVAAVLVVAVVGWNLLPAGPTSIGVPEPTSTPVPSLASTPTPAPTRPWWVSPEDAARPCGEGPDGNGCAGELSAGTHQSVGFVPPFQFTVPAGWVNTGAFAGWFVLVPDTPANRANVEEAIIVVPDFPHLESSCADVPNAASTPSAAQLVAAIQAANGVETTVPSPVTVGALSGQSVDLQLSAGWTATCPEDPTTPTAPVLGSRIKEGERHRFIALDAPGGRNFLIMLSARDQATFDSFTAAAMPVVESFEFDFGPGGSPSPS